MSEEKKEEGCCGSSAKSGCGCCGGMKKMVVGAVLAALVFTCGYIFGKGSCPFKGDCSKKVCPLTPKQ